MDTINLLDSLLPEREESLQNENEKAKLEQEKLKRLFYINEEQ